MPRCATLLVAVLGLLLASGCGEVDEAPSAPVDATAEAPSAKGRLPYARIEAIALAAAPGDIIEVELDGPDPGEASDAGPAIYEITVLAPTGRVLELEIDAATGVILKQEAE